MVEEMVVGEVVVEAMIIEGMVMGDESGRDIGRAVAMEEMVEEEMMLGCLWWR